MHHKNNKMYIIKGKQNIFIWKKYAGNIKKGRIEIEEYSWFDIYPFFKEIHKYNYNKISFDWYNRLGFMKTGCEIKII